MATVHPPLPPAPKPSAAGYGPYSPDQAPGTILLLFRETQDARDDHAEACHGRELGEANPCIRLRTYDATLRYLWKALEIRGADDLAAVYGLRP